MNIAEGFAAEFASEAASTRKFLERLDDSHADWQPHEKSMSLSRLASHLVEAPDWAATILDSDRFDFGTADYQQPHWKTRAELLDNHARIAARFVELLDGRSDESMRAPWQLLLNGQVLEDTVRDAAIRNFILSHLIHHRGQLSVYYRLLGIPVPGPYGPSADDQDN